MRNSVYEALSYIEFVCGIFLLTFCFRKGNCFTNQQTLLDHLQIIIFDEDNDDADMMIL